MKVVQFFRIYGCLLALMFTGCIKEDLEICLPQSVQVAFTFVPSAECVESPTIPMDINLLTVFVFDQYGIFVQQVDTISPGTAFQMELLLIPADYQIIAVAGYDEDQLVGIPFIPSVTNIRDAAVASFLEQRDESLRSAEHVLYIGVDKLTVIPEIPDQELAMTLVQQTKVLTVRIDGIANSRYQIALVGNAAQYTFEMEQEYLMGSPLIYIPVEGEGNLYEGTTLVNWPLKNNGDNTRLQIIDPETGLRVVNEDLLELILRVPNIDLECSTGFNIEIEYRVGRGLVIYIENWKVYDGGYILI